MTETFSPPTSNFETTDGAITPVETMLISQVPGDSVIRARKNVPEPHPMIEFPDTIITPAKTVAAEQRPMIEFPYYEVNPGRSAVPGESNYVTKIDESKRLKNDPSISSLRERFSFIDHLDETESYAFMAQIVGVAQVELQKDQPQQLAGAIHDVLGLAFFRHKTEASRGSGRVDVSGGNTITVDPDLLRAESTNMMVRIKEQGIELKDPADVLLVNATYSLGHEIGHVVGSVMANELGLTNRSTQLHKAFLAEHPEDALTGLIDSDPNIHDEQFADGMSQVVTFAVLKALGYNANESRTMFAIMSHAGMEYAAHDMRHIDMVEQARDNSVSSIGLMALKLAGFRSEELMYEGGLGYGTPLDVQHVVKVFDFFTKHTLEGSRLDNSVIQASGWREAVDAAHGGDVHPMLRARIDVRNTAK